MSVEKIKKFLLKALKRTGIAIAVITVLTVFLAFGTYVYHSACLKKESALIKHAKPLLMDIAKGYQENEELAQGVDSVWWIR